MRLNFFILDRARTKFSDEQKAILNTHLNNYGSYRINMADVEMLAENLGMSPKTCLIYFHNRRQAEAERVKKLNHIH